jgi:DNA-binding CsgD family transcriptional regulator
MNGQKNRQIEEALLPQPLAEGYLTRTMFAVQDPCTHALPNSEGFLLLTSSMVPTFVNRTAAEILVYPQRPEDLRKNLDAFLVKRIHDILLAKDSSSRTPALVTQFSSGRRAYRCRAFQISATQREAEPAFAAIFERASIGTFSLIQASEKFHLTVREREVMQYLLTGLTTKEIASGMAISPNTVKAFLRMIMVKMGVSTRSAIVGKAFMP